MINNKPFNYLFLMMTSFTAISSLMLVAKAIIDQNVFKMITLTVIFFAMIYVTIDTIKTIKK